MISTLKFVDVCFKTEAIMCFGKCSVGAWIECAFCYCWVRYSINVDSDFPSSCSINCSERYIQFSNYNSPLRLISFGFMYFAALLGTYTVMIIYFPCGLTVVSFFNAIGDFLCYEIIIIEMNIEIPAYSD